MNTAQTKDDTTLTMINDTEARITRTFRAPRVLVWEAMTKPEHVREWYGPRDTQVKAIEMDLRVGGTWRIVLSSPRGDHAFSGEYLDVQSPKRLQQTWRYEPIPQASSIETMTLEDRGETTRMITHVKHASKEALQGHLANGMEEGMRETYERLDELVRTMVP
ncbi:MAG: SRPBCC family protein [Thermoplasmatota archaeon]